MDDAKLNVEGLEDLRKDLRKIDKDLPKQLAAGLAEAAEIVAVGARAKVPRRTGKAAESIKVRKSQKAATLAVGGTRAEYFPWLDFGGRVGRHKSVSRPFSKVGRYIYPTLAEKADEVKAKVDQAMASLAADAGFDSKGTG